MNKGIIVNRHQRLVLAAALSIGAVAVAVAAPPEAQSSAAQPPPPATQSMPNSQQQSAAQAPTAPHSMSSQDMTFIHKAAKGGMMQVALGKVAALEGQNAKVRKFALQSVENFSKAGGMLAATARSLGVKLPQQPPGGVQKLSRALAADHGALVDQEYLAQIVPASTVAVNLFKSEAQGGSNPKLVMFAQQMLPKLEMHRQMAVHLAEGGGPPTRQRLSEAGKPGQPQAQRQ